MDQGICETTPVLSQDQAVPALDATSSRDTTMFSGLPGDIESVISPHTEADPVALLVHLLAEYSCIIGHGSWIEVDGGRSPLSFWPVCVGDSSKSRKGTADKRIKGLFQYAYPTWTRGEMRGSLSSGEGLVSAVRDSDGQDDPGIQDKRLYLVQSEFGSVLKVMNREGNSLSGVLRDAFDGGDLAPMTKNSRIRATAPSIVIVGHVTKDELTRHLQDTEASNGFGNRFCWFYVQRAKILPFGGTVPQAEWHALACRLTDAITHGMQAGPIGMTPAAQELWCAVYPTLSEGKPGLVGALLARSEAQVRRIAALYALMDTCHMVDVCHLQAALALWKFSEESVRWIFGDATGDPIADKIVVNVRICGELTDTDIQKLFMRNFPAARLLVAKQKLMAEGLIHSVVSPPTGGRPGLLWRPGPTPAAAS